MNLQTPPHTPGLQLPHGPMNGDAGAVLPPDPTDSPKMNFSTAPDQIDYASINLSALAVLPALLEKLLPDGRIEYSEYVALNPTRDDATPGSFKVNMLSGKWSDFATEEPGGDVVSLVAYLTGVEQGEAARNLAEMVQSLSASEVARATNELGVTTGKADKTPVIPVPEDALIMNYRHPKYGAPSQDWPYHDAEGRLVGYAARFDYQDPEGNTRKDIRPITYCELSDGRRDWRAKGIPVPRPLYRLPEILSRSDAPVIVTEGEKTADAAQQLFPDYASTTPMHGAMSPHKTDWSPLAGKKVVIAPDHDDAGRDYAKRVAKLCRDTGAAGVCEMRFPADLVIRDGAPVPRDGATPKSWDLADALAEGWTPELVGKALKNKTLQIVEFDAPADAENGASEWPEPVDLLGETVEAAAPFPMEFLPGAFQRYVADVTEQMQCPPDFVAIPLIIGAASLIGRRFRMSPKAKSKWPERPCLWGGMIGASGSNKSAAFSAALAPIARIQSKMVEEHKDAVLRHINSIGDAEAAESAWKTDTKTARKKGLPPPPKPKEAEKPVKPVMQQVVSDDVTVEGLVDMMARTGRDPLLRRDELSGWFHGLNQYKKGGNDRQFFLQCHAGGQFGKNRKSSGATFLDDLFLCIAGGFQPHVIRSVLADGDQDGLTARFSLLVWPDENPEFTYVDREADEDAAWDVDWIMRQLLKLEPHDIFVEASRNSEEGMNFNPDTLLRFDDEAQGIFIEWYVNQQKRLRTKGIDPAWRSHLSKYAGLFARLSIVHHLIRVADKTAKSPIRVDAETARQVRRFIDEYLEPHAKRIYRHLGQDPAREGARRIAEWIVATPDLTEFTARTVRRKNWSGLTDQDSVNKALDYLENVAGWAASPDNPPGPRGGRPTTKYFVNPKVRQQE